MTDDPLCLSPSSSGEEFEVEEDPSLDIPFPPPEFIKFRDEDRNPTLELLMQCLDTFQNQPRLLAQLEATLLGNTNTAAPIRTHSDAHFLLPSAVALRDGIASRLQEGEEHPLELLPQSISFPSHAEAEAAAFRRKDRNMQTPVVAQI